MLACQPGLPGAFMAGALFELKRIPGVERPAIAIVIPTPRTSPACRRRRQRGLQA